MATLRGLPVGFSILIGACVVLWLLSIFRGNNRALMIGSSVMMTVGTGAMAAATRDNLPAVYGILVVAGLGIGGIVVPASVITTIICPDDLIATVAALTLSIRVIGGAIGFTVYYNVFYAKLVPKLTEHVLKVCLTNGIYEEASITTHRPTYRRQSHPTDSESPWRRRKYHEVGVDCPRGRAGIRRGISVCLLREYCVRVCIDHSKLYVG